MDPASSRNIPLQDFSRRGGRAQDFGRWYNLADALHATGGALAVRDIRVPRVVEGAATAQPRVERVLHPDTRAPAAAQPCGHVGTPYGSAVVVPRAADADVLLIDRAVMNGHVAGTADANLERTGVDALHRQLTRAAEVDVEAVG